MEALKQKLKACTLVIFGASGDLTRRKLVPALHTLDCEGLLPEGLQVVGVARSDYTTEEFREKLRSGVEQYGRLKPERWDGFAERLHYLSGGYDDRQTYRRLQQLMEKFDAEDGTHDNRLFYLALPPEVYSRVIHCLGETDLDHSDAGWTRLIIEKPFGHDLDSAQRLNEEVHAYFDEDQVYRIDHYLGKETVQNILAFRFANLMFESVWSRNYVDHVQITAAESVGVEHRAGYYDQSGVIRDMVQNHLLQLLALATMEPPVAMNAKTLRDEKVQVLQAIRPLSLDDMVLGQYRGYRDEQDVQPGSNTPTYVAMKLFIDNWRWQGVPVYLRSGKSLERKATELTMVFKHVPHLIFTGEKRTPANVLSLCIQPDEGMHLRFALKAPGSEMRIKPVAMDFHYDELVGDGGLPDAYERLLLDALLGDASLFARSDEIERGWELTTPILHQWERLSDPPLKFYSPGSWGPEAANELFEAGAWASCCIHDPEINA